MLYEHVRIRLSLTRAPPPPLPPAHLAMPCHSALAAFCRTEPRSRAFLFVTHDWLLNWTVTREMKRFAWVENEYESVCFSEWGMNTSLFVLSSDPLFRVPSLPVRIPLCLYKRGRSCLQRHTTQPPLPPASKGLCCLTVFPIPSCSVHRDSRPSKPCLLWSCMGERW
jgi:hypothetical protein